VRNVPTELHYHHLEIELVFGLEMREHRLQGGKHLIVEQTDKLQILLIRLGVLPLLICIEVYGILRGGGCRRE